MEGPVPRAGLSQAYGRACPRSGHVPSIMKGLLANEFPVPTLDHLRPVADFSQLRDPCKVASHLELLVSSVNPERQYERLATIRHEILEACIFPIAEFMLRTLVIIHAVQSSCYVYIWYILSICIYNIKYIYTGYIYVYIYREREI